MKHNCLQQMQSKSDGQLLREYAETRLEAAFTEIVVRHTNLVYSAALRHVNAPDLASDIAQRVFIGLAQSARPVSQKIGDDASLAGWLCRSARNLSLKLRRDEVRRYSRERRAMENFDTGADTGPDWEQLRPVLDEAISSLSEPDYDALVIRFFNNQDLRSVGLALGVSDDAAQKRVSRALDKLRALLLHRGIATQTALSAVLSANAVQPAPAGLPLAISAAAAFIGTPAQTSCAITACKALAMTTLQKTLITATFLAAAITALYESRQVSMLRGQIEMKRQKDVDLIHELQSQRNEATNRFAKLQMESDHLKSSQNYIELMRLRAELGRFKAATSQIETDSIESASATLVKKVNQIRKWVEQTPGQNIPELQLLPIRAWLLTVVEMSNWQEDRKFSFYASYQRQKAKSLSEKAV
jgi:RNA polymerase sigma factor (sigma-70 family)